MPFTLERTPEREFFSFAYKARLRLHQRLSFEHRSPLDRGAGGERYSPRQRQAVRYRVKQSKSGVRSTVARKAVRSGETACPPQKLRRATIMKHKVSFSSAEPKARGRGRTRPPQTAQGDGTPELRLWRILFWQRGLRIGKGTTTFPPMSDL